MRDREEERQQEEPHAALADVPGPAGVESERRAERRRADPAGGEEHDHEPREGEVAGRGEAEKPHELEEREHPARKVDAQAGDGDPGRRHQADVDQQEPASEQRGGEHATLPARRDAHPVRHRREQEAEDEAREEAVEEEVRVRPRRRDGPGRARVPPAVASGEVGEPPYDRGHALRRADEEEDAVRGGGEDGEAVHCSPA